MLDSNLTANFHEFFTGAWGDDVASIMSGPSVLTLRRLYRCSCWGGWWEIHDICSEHTLGFRHSRKRNFSSLAMYSADRLQNNNIH